MTIQIALEHHLAGRLSQAEKLYLEILEANPTQADALYLLGVIAHQTGKKTSANDFLVKAIHASPTNPIYYKTLGDILSENGALNDAAIRYRQALLYMPGDVDQLFSRIALWMRGRKPCKKFLESNSPKLTLHFMFMLPFCSISSVSIWDELAAAIRQAYKDVTRVCPA